MDTKEQNDIIHEIVRRYGKTAQTDVAIEEMAELTNVLMKERRKRVEAKDIVTEIADVTIMMRQMAVIYGVDEVEREIEFKLSRQRERMDVNDLVKD